MNLSKGAMVGVISYITSKSINVFVLVLSVCIILYSSSHLPLLWMFFAFSTIYLFFKHIKIFFARWRSISSQQFKSNLFKTAFLIRVITVIFLYLFFELMNGNPFEFYAADSMGYNELGISVRNWLLNGEYNLFDKLWYVGFSDKGFPIFLGITYYIFYNSIFIFRIINALLSAWSCIFIYKIALRNFDDKVARLAGILCMLLPNLIYYSGLHLKETIMVFLLIVFIERTDFLLRLKRNNTKVIIIIALCGVSLFLFRTVLGVSAFVAAIGAFLFTANKISKFSKRLFKVVWILLVALIFISGKVYEEAQQYWAAHESNIESQMHFFSTREGANQLAEYGSTAIFAPIILFAPFPTLVNIEGQENQMMLAGAYFTRNIYAFFVVIGLFALFKKKQLRNHLLMILFVLLYLGILANSGFALSERFHLPAVPFLLIFAAYGITQMNKKNKRYFIPYLIFISIIIIGWNWFKLAGRGLV